MAEAATLHDAFIDELRDTYDAERQLTKALPKLARRRARRELRDAFESHLEETRGQIERLEQVFASLDEKVRGKHCDGIAGIIEEGKSIMEEDFDDDHDGRVPDRRRPARRALRDGRLRHAGRLGAGDGPRRGGRLLQQTLDEEKAADEKLSSLAEGGINQEAASMAHPGEDEDAEEQDEDEPPVQGPAQGGAAWGASGKNGSSKNSGMRASRR